MEHRGWDADTQIQCPSYTYGSPLEDLTLTAEQREDIIQTQLKESAVSKRALIVKVSHIGGHKYAGNCIVQLFFFCGFRFFDKADDGFFFLSLFRFIHRKGRVFGMAVSHHTMSNPLLRTLLLVASCCLLYSAEDSIFRDPAASL